VHTKLADPKAIKNELGGTVNDVVLMSRQRLFDLVVTNVPGPQFSLYLMGRRAVEPFPMVPLGQGSGPGRGHHELDGRMNFGLVGDYDVLHDIDDLARDLYDSISELADYAGVELLTAPPPPLSEEPARVSW